MDITYLGHSSFRLRGKSVSLISDPFDPKKVELKFPKISADLVTVSHAHADHGFVQAVSDVKKIIDGPGEYEISGVSIIGFGTYHDSKKGVERGKNTIYVIEMDDLRLVHLGDLGHRLTEDVLGELGEVDVLMIPVGGIYTIGPSEAGEVVRDIEPRITIPMHYKISGINQEVFGELATVDDFLREVSLPVERLEKLSIKKNELGEEMKVVVLEKKS